MSPMLEDELRATLAAHARDVNPDAHLADAAMNRAVRLRRTRRLQIAAGAVAVVGVVALVPVLASLGPTDHSAPPVQPIPSPVPVPEVVMQQARETHALIATPTTIVDGTGADVITVPAAPAPVAADLTPENQVVWLSRASGGYLTRLLPSLFGAWTYATAPPGVVNFVRPDGSTTLLGHPTPENFPVVSPDGSLVAFETTGTAGGQKELVVTDLNGRTLHEQPVTGSQQGLYLTARGLWFACVPRVCKTIEERTPHYWTFADDTVTSPSFAQPSVWLAQAGDVVITGESTGQPSITAFDMSDPASPTPLWTSAVPLVWGSFDGSGTTFLVGDIGKEQSLLLDAATGKVLDRLPLASSVTNPVWTPNREWLTYSVSDDFATMKVTALTPGSDGTLTTTSSGFPPYETKLAELPTFALIGHELAPPQP